MAVRWVLLAAWQSSALAIAAVRGSLIDTNLFTGGQGGYFCYRLPNLLQMRAPGHLVAIAQAKPGPGCPDSGQMDAVVRWTRDNGKTWSTQILVAPNPQKLTYGTPTAVVDPTTDTIYLFLCVNFKRVLLLNSTDGGGSWSEPQDLTSTLLPSSWGRDASLYYGTQQGIAVDMGGGRRRLILCANHHGAGSNGANSVFSDDHGATWQNGATVAPGKLGECAFAQTVAGLTMYARVVYDDSSNAPRRALAFSTDYGVSFSPGDTSAFPGNPGADSEGAFIEAGGVFLVGGPWGEPDTGRHNYTVLVSPSTAGRVSTWGKLPSAAPLFAGQAEYSTMCVPSAANGTFFVMYERGDIYNGKGFLRLTQLNLPTPAAAAEATGLSGSA